MIAKWKAKAVVQKCISFLPQKDKINFFFQKYVTKGVYLTDEYFGFKITHAHDHLNYFQKFSNKSPEESTVLELGTGWYPIIPIALYLSDYQQIISIDIESWMNRDRQLTTIEKFLEWRVKGKLDEYLPQINEEKWQELVKLTSSINRADLTTEEINETIRLTPLIRDARQTQMEGGSIDLICSNNTFEHIPQTILIDIIREFWRILIPNGVMSHFIDLSDHFAHFDSSINIYNFLRYSSKTWSIIDNSIQPQNRLRFKDYRKIYHDLSIPITEESYRKGDLEALKTIPLAPEYADYTPEELAISHGYLVSVKGK